MRARFAILVGLLVGLAAVTGGVAVSSGATPRARPAQASDQIGFSHAVVVDQQRPGFEPDVKVDSNGEIFTSVPFGFSTTQSFVWDSRDGGNSYQFMPGNTRSRQARDLRGRR